MPLHTQPPDHLLKKSLPFSQDSLSLASLPYSGLVILLCFASPRLSLTHNRASNLSLISRTLTRHESLTNHHSRCPPASRQSTRSSFGLLPPRLLQQIIPCYVERSLSSCLGNTSACLLLMDSAVLPPCLLTQSSTSAILTKSTPVAPSVSR